jgi:hypothetical protein
MRYLSVIFLCCISFAQTKPARPSQWRFTVLTDRMDESKIYVLMNSSINSRSDKPLEFEVMCKDGTLDAFFTGNEIVDFHDSSVDIRTRLDGFDPAEETWDSVTSGHGFIITGFEAEGFIHDVSGAKTLLVEYPIYREGKAVAQFNVSGLKAQLPKLRCEKPKVTPYHPKVGIRCGGSVTEDCYDEANLFHAKR